jgi:hypothetical protein
LLIFSLINRSLRLAFRTHPRENSP